MAGVNFIIAHTTFNNGETDVKCVGCRYHETATGYAQAGQKDVDNFLGDLTWSDITFSDGVMKDWSEDLTNCLTNGDMIINPVIDQQIVL